LNKKENREENRAASPRREALARGKEKKKGLRKWKKPFVRKGKKIEKRGDEVPARNARRKQQATKEGENKKITQIGGKVGKKKIPQLGIAATDFEGVRTTEIENQSSKEKHTYRRVQRDKTEKPSVTNGGPKKRFKQSKEGPQKRCNFLRREWGGNGQLYGGCHGGKQTRKKRKKNK